MPKSRTKQRNEMINFNPILTYHAIDRISERLCKPRVKKCSIIINWQLVTYEKEANWIDPKFFWKILWDIKSSIFEMTYYHPEKWLITEWKYWYYVLSPMQEVITVYKDFKPEYKKNSTNVDFRFRSRYFNLDAIESKYFNSWRNHQEEFWHLIK